MPTDPKRPQEFHIILRLITDPEVGKGKVTEARVRAVLRRFFSKQWTDDDAVDQIRLGDVIDVTR